MSFPPLNGVELKVYPFDFNAANATKEIFPEKVKQQMLIFENFVPT